MQTTAAMSYELWESEYHICSNLVILRPFYSYLTCGKSALVTDQDRGETDLLLDLNAIVELSWCYRDAVQKKKNEDESFT